MEKLLSAVERVPFDITAAEQSGKVLGHLAARGKSIGDFDAQIAGHALALKAQLATRNKRHFQRIEGLKLVD